MQSISVARDYARTPGPRYIAEGDFSGEGFRKILAPLVRRALESNEVLQVDLDGTAGYGTSFLEEVFGGLVRENGFTAADLTRVLKIKSEEEEYLTEEVRAYIAEAQEQVNGRKR